MTKLEFDDACKFALSVGATVLPTHDQLHFGGIVGMVEIVDHVRTHPSRWFIGPTALVLRNPYPLPFRPMTGAVGFFEA